MKAAIRDPVLLSSPLASSCASSTSSRIRPANDSPPSHSPSPPAHPASSPRLLEVVFVAAYGRGADVLGCAQSRLHAVLFAQDPVVVLEHEIMYGKTMEISQEALGHDFVIPFGKVTSVSGASERARASE